MAVSEGIRGCVAISGEKFCDGTEEVSGGCTAIEGVAVLDSPGFTVTAWDGMVSGNKYEQPANDDKQMDKIIKAMLDLRILTIPEVILIIPPTTSTSAGQYNLGGSEPMGSQKDGKHTVMSHILHIQ